MKKNYHAENFMQDLNSPDGNFPLRLKQAIKAKNITQKQLAEHVNIKATSISRYMMGERTPGVMELFRLAIFLEVSMEWLLMGIGNEPHESQDTDYWKRRALAAEEELTALQDNLQSLLGGKRTFESVDGHGLSKKRENRKSAQ